ncbi:hypothetical protein [Desmospora activa]|uniref:Uncharacterized protein n=1 Tax=Desmospora activa DSM 45169 TaxID=1121389 RepID=A0A2T4Z990_9BACL|nr:hypothetical protein [Desmospora activa]PTM58461.1 hypothetical protein C8J48_1044 [Desmospora activa DSM 45169]
MVQFVVDSMLGPYGKIISNWYLDHQMLVNTFVIAIVLFKRLQRRSRPTTPEANESSRVS